MKSDTSFPVARTERLVVENVGDEAVIYDLDTNVAHALKPLAAAVFMYADGKNSPAEIAELVSYRVDASVSEDDVNDALAQLDSLSLLASPVIQVIDGGLSRRDALKAFAAVGAGTALISSVAAPAALAGSSCVGLDCVTGKGGSINAGGGVSYPQPTSWNSNGSPNVTYGGTCSYTSNGKSMTGQWQCVPCDHCFGYQCCQVVCAPAGVGDAWGTGTYSVGPEYTQDGYYGKYCTTHNEQCAPHCS